MNKFLSFLEAIGRDVEHGLEKILPLAQAAVPVVTLINPAIGPLFASTVATVSAVEQKFAALDKQTGSGTQKLADALTIIGPVIQDQFAKAGLANDAQTVQNYVNAVVSFLNSIPAAGTAVTVTPAPAPASH